MLVIEKKIKINKMLITKKYKKSNLIVITYN